MLIQYRVRRSAFHYEGKRAHIQTGCDFPVGTYVEVHRGQHHRPPIKEVDVIPKISDSLSYIPIRVCVLECSWLTTG